MTQEEIMAKYQPRQLEKQVEFEQVMQQMNQDQALENHPYIDRIMEIQKQRELLNIQKQAIQQQLSALGAEQKDLEAKQKVINRAYHNVKHEWHMLNPRERFIRKDDGTTATDC